MAYQIEPCPKEGDDCDVQERIREVPLALCSTDKQEEIREYLARTRAYGDVTRYGDKALCADMEDLYITGEPETRSEASLIIDFTYSPDFDRDFDE